MAARPRDPVLSIRMPARLLERVRASAVELGVTPSQAGRMLVAAALGDDASMIAVREAAGISESARRKLLQTVAHELGPTFDEARARFVDDVESASITHRDRPSEREPGAR